MSHCGAEVHCSLESLPLGGSRRILHCGALSHCFLADCYWDFVPLGGWRWMSHCGAQVHRTVESLLLGGSRRKTHWGAITMLVGGLLYAFRTVKRIQDSKEHLAVSLRMFFVRPHRAASTNWWNAYRMAQPPEWYVASMQMQLVGVFPGQDALCTDNIANSRLATTQRTPCSGCL